ncbi:hypothetical protein [Oribacterium sp. P6A1]|uniref:hypothetical protein n=1 Tax=Oribacterium sp. P6A1 TaxID=1410612 RepID=UPI000564A063|nr:hypothetical protein [Oribacterium sp. P6A1]
MKKLGIMMATAAFTMAATLSAFAYHGNSHNYAANYCNDYVCDETSEYGAYCAGNYEACYRGNGNGAGAYCTTRNYRGCAGIGYCSNSSYRSCR